MNKLISEFRRNASIKECLHPNSNNCNKVIRAHSIQNNKYLSLLEYPINGQNKVYSVREFDFEDDGQLNFKPVGRNKATTFTGFCGFHDNSIFKKIESGSFEITGEQVFLHGYRAFNSSYHSYKEWLKGHINDENQKKRFKSIHDYHDFTIQNLMNMNSINVQKSKIDLFLTRKKWDGLHSIILRFNDQKFPFACCGVAAVNVMPNHEYINNGSYCNLLITVLPDNNGSVVIISCFTGDKSGRRFIDNLPTLSREDLARVLTSLIVVYTDSTVFSPCLFEILDDSGKGDILHNVAKSRNRQNFGMKEFQYLRVNLFHRTMNLDTFRSFLDHKK